MKSMFLFLSLLSCMPAVASNVSDNKQDQVDLNQTATGGYGYFINQDQKASVWWAEGAYKVLKDAPVPRKSQSRVSLSAAKNEYESFIIVVNPESEMENFRISVADFTSSDGKTIPGDQVEIRKVEYVKVSHPTDYYGYKGYFPDPLPLYEKPLTLKASENTPLWITVHVPSQTAAGQYTSEVTLTAANGWKTTVPVDLMVRNFELPAVPTIRSGWGMNMKIGKLRNGYQKEIDKAIHQAEAAERQFKEKDAIIDRQRKQISLLDRKANPQRYSLSSGAELVRINVSNYRNPSLHIWTRVGDELFDNIKFQIDYDVAQRHFNGQITDEEFVNAVFEPQEQVNGKQAELLGTAFTLAAGGPAEVHVGTGSGGSSSDLPWNDNVAKKHTSVKRR